MARLVRPTHRPRWLWPALLALLLGLSAACTPIQAPTPAPATTIPELTIHLADDGIHVPEVVPGGIVAVNVENTGTQMRAVQLWRIADNSTRADILAFDEHLEDNPDDFFGIFALGSWIHYIQDVAPGTTYRFYADLGTGEFFIFDDVNPDLPIVFFAASEVVGTVAPQAAISVDMADFAYIMPDSLPAGKQLWEFTNSGTQWHLAAIIGAAPEVSTEALLALFSGPDGPPPADMPVEVFGGMPPMSPGERVWVEFDLAAGEYELICPLPDLASFGPGGPPMSHLEHGMRRAFTVTD